MKIVNISIQNGEGFLCATDYKEKLIEESRVLKLDESIKLTEKEILEDSNNYVTAWSEEKALQATPNTYFRMPKELYKQQMAFHKVYSSGSQIIFNKELQETNLSDYSLYIREHEDVRTTVNEIIEFIEETFEGSKKVKIEDCSFTCSLLSLLNDMCGERETGSSYLFKNEEDNKAFHYFLDNPDKVVSADFDEKLLLSKEAYGGERIERAKECPMIYAEYLKRPNFRKILEATFTKEPGKLDTLYFFIDYLATKVHSLRWSGSDPSWVEDSPLWSKYMLEARVAYGLIVGNNSFYRSDVEGLEEVYNIEEIKKYRITANQNLLEDFIRLQEIKKNYSILKDYDIVVV